MHMPGPARVSRWRWQQRKFAFERLQTGGQGNQERGFFLRGRPLEKVVETDPDNADAWNQMGFSLRNLQQYDDALAAYDKALAIDPKHKGALEYLGELFLMTDQPELAQAQLEKLDDACLLSCKEFRKLKKRIAAYKGGP